MDCGQESAYLQELAQSQPKPNTPGSQMHLRLTHLNTMAHLDSEVEEECLRKDLKFYFMNPCEKYRARRQIPWKLGLQILKIAMVTTQLVCFGLSNQLVVSFKEENTLAFKHVFLKGYPGIDEDDYSCSVYTEKDTYESIFFAISQYQHLMDITLGILGHGENEDNRIGLKVCKKYYKKETVFPSETLNTDNNIEIGSYKSKSPFASKALTYRRFIPESYQTITFDNKAHSGKIKIYFDSDANIEECKNLNISGSSQKNTQYILVFDAFVIVICLASLILCTRSIVLALRLRKRFLNFFLEKNKRHVCNSDQWKFINGWYVLVIISDLMTITGSILKMEIKAKNLADYDLCSILLGTSTLFVWVGVIRYLGYFQAYNVLILTMQASLPKVLRFCACAGMIYLGYMFCGWIVLGPYHDKFEDLNIVAECLFSLVNGDDIFATFTQIQQKSILVWLFIRLYLYSFISLFIYMILSLFIALITDSYDTIKVSNHQYFLLKNYRKFRIGTNTENTTFLKYQQSGFPETDLQKFLKECSSKEKYQQ
ncbi:hypothetical protein MC885_004491 [Smutsia gigantea]|nr:hypothetical protein MC885_004491 [Smutsia gigantea]